MSLRQLSWRRPGRVVLAALAVTLGLAGVVYAAAAAARKPAPALSLRAARPRQTVSARRSATYRLEIVRGRALITPARRGRRRVAASVTLSVGKPLPAGVTATLRPRTTRANSATLTLGTAARTQPGTFRIRVNASGCLVCRRHGRVQRAQITLFLVVAPVAGGRPAPPVVTPAQPAAPAVVTPVVAPATPVVTPPTPIGPAAQGHDIGISGSVPGLLEPGSTLPVALTITNPSDSALTVTGLTIGIGPIQAPHATVLRGCTAADFVVSQFTGQYGFVIAAGATRSLAELGIPADEWPQLTMINRAVNQNGCKQASVTLEFTASGSGEGT